VRAADAFEALMIDDGHVRARVRRAYARALCVGHFPGDPFLPGAYLAGLMAELGGRLAAGRPLARLVRCVFRRRVTPDGDIVVVARRVPRGRVEAEVHAGGACAAQATLVFGRPA
jgi:3-hydroxymyristoyl/3-hydroxydecanoyl-(acyl carrier protein) dehydratase